MQYNYIIKDSDISWTEKRWPNDPERKGLFKALWQGHGAEQLEMRVTRMEGGETCTKFHCHTKEEEWFYILRGTCHIYLEDAWHLLEPGDSIFKPPNTWHTFRNIGDEPCDLLMVGPNIEGSEVIKGEDPALPS